MISYAQNAEDVVLWRALGATQPTGYFIDVGAGHPIFDSVTKAFSLAGWGGIHVEPMHRECELLREDRPSEVVMEVALSRAPGRLTLYEAPMDNRGASTLVADVAEEQIRLGYDFHPVEVEVDTLASVFARAAAVVDFLKIDVEGAEEDVIAGGDWDRFHPRVVVVEATKPQTSEPSHWSWEPNLLAHGYRFALFDGLNRFYAHEDEGDELFDALSKPANVLDGYDPYRYVAELDGAKDYISSLEDALSREGVDARFLKLKAGSLPSAGLDHADADELRLYAKGLEADVAGLAALLQDAKVREQALHTQLEALLRA
jgi:FkbM family methyltransferase